ncbi:MAG: serine--tRNA ligase, partial [Primorskyibacter sp.]
MHDIRAIRDTPAEFDAALARRGMDALSSSILSLDEARRAAIHAAETAQSDQKKAAKDVGAAKARGDEVEFTRLRTLVGDKKAEVTAMQARAKALDTELTGILMGLPNAAHPDAPQGADEDDNVEIRRWGSPREFDFTPVEHFEITGVVPGMDFETAAKLSGSRFMVLGQGVARLHRALAQFMIDTHVEEHGLSETWTPVLVREEMMYGTGQLPKFGEDSYKTTNGWWMVPTAEVTLTNLVNGLTVDADSLPRRYVAHTQCFRSEAGSYGRDTRGLIR